MKDEADFESTKSSLPSFKIETNVNGSQSPKDWVGGGERSQKQRLIGGQRRWQQATRNQKTTTKHREPKTR
jgi:hypothetical protein